MPESTHDNIISLPNNHLRQRSKKVGIVTDEVLALIEQMKTATLDWENSREYEVGVALSAVQLDHLARIVIIRDDFETKDNKNFTVFVNPVITKYEGEIIEDYEGCLSVKDIYGRVPRYKQVRVKAYDVEGREFRLKANGFFARVIQHEIDHTNGILFIDHIKNKPDAFFELDNDGHLKEIDYDKVVKNSRILW